MAELRPVNVAANYFAGRNQASDEHQQGVRNKLAEREMGLRENIYASNQASEQRQLTAEQEKQFATVMMQAAQYGIQSPKPKAFIEQNYPQLAQLAGAQWQALDDEGVRGKLQEAIGVWGPKAGIGPAAPPPAIEQTKGPNGSTIITRGGQMQVVQPQKPESGPVRYRPATPQDIAAYGLPPGTAGKINTETNELEVLSKRDNTGNLSQKDQTTAKLKLNTVKIAKKQLEAIRSAFLGGVDPDTGKRDASKGIKGTFSAGFGGQGRLPTEGGKAFDAAVDQMRSTLTALTRVPGVGAMSDYETKLDQAKFPSRANYENVTEQQINALEDQLSLIESGYSDLLSGAGNDSGQAPNAAPAPAGDAGQPVQVRNAAEAAALPSGTVFITPDGRRKVRP